MSQEFEDDDSQESPQEETQDVMGILRKMQQQLNFLEKKIDTLIRQTPGRPPFRGGGSFSKPARSYGHSHHSDGNRSFGDREGNFAPRRFDRPRDGDSRGGYGPKKKPFYHGRRERS